MISIKFFVIYDFEQSTSIQSKCIIQILKLNFLRFFFFLYQERVTWTCLHSATSDDSPELETVWHDIYSCARFCRFLCLIRKQTESIPSKSCSIKHDSGSSRDLCVCVLNFSTVVFPWDPLHFTTADCFYTIFHHYITYCLLVTEHEISFCQFWSQIFSMRNGRQSRCSFRDVICSIGNLLTLVPCHVWHCVKMIINLDLSLFGGKW